MGYHDRCFEDIPYLESKDPYHNNRRDRLTESAINRYAETNPEYQKVLDKYYRPDKKLPRAITTTKKSAVVKESSTSKITNSTTKEIPMCCDSRCSSASNSSERLCPNCKQKFYASKKKTSTIKDKKENDSNLIYWNKNKFDDNHVPTFPPRPPNECTSLILPAMFTEEEKKYYQSKQPKYPPVEKITSVIENKPPRSKPSGQYNIITGEELYEIA
ncbi:hypothetical protein BCR32DRAFT_271954 [Anaeromyces robustus]|uniref:Uncharacterized protein n=1 Tax=Anaeromyces robustus TaxID=1754192 RepID=A0A1Y1WPB8_9FUNG|nr:hypothetical protein BCR32DRAFT_271954 [Anaeromyces robustus]|eukprot:ORX75370.1 hypothetical protein BCR32DRAFT_271954 [Anaeromyces robustus]